MKYRTLLESGRITNVAPVRERGLKFVMPLAICAVHNVAPVRERGLKLCVKKDGVINAMCRSREGAWIEILM